MLAAAYPRPLRPVNEFSTGETILFDTTFPGTSLPANFSATGWTCNNGLTPPAGTFTTFTQRAFWNKYTTLDRVETSVRVSFTSTARLAIMRQSVLGGSLMELNTVRNMILAYGIWDTANNSPTNVFSQNLVFPVIFNRDYDITLQKLGGQINFIITDTVSGASQRVQFADNYPRHLGRAWGNPGFVHLQGSYTIKRFQHKALFPTSPKVLILGDSFIDGDSTRAFASGHYSRWAYKVWEYLKGDCAFSGRGGDDSAALITRLDVDLDSFSPNYVIVAIGTNDSVYSTWLANLNTIIARIEARGAVPILSTMAPRADRQTFLNSANSYIRSQGTYDFLDIERVLANNWGTSSPTWKPEYTVPTEATPVHPNEPGQGEIFARTFIDIPQIYS